jgi:hypothetical protein
MSNIHVGKSFGMDSQIDLNSLVGHVLQHDNALIIQWIAGEDDTL